MYSVRHNCYHATIVFTTYDVYSYMLFKNASVMTAAFREQAVKTLGKNAHCKNVRSPHYKKHDRDHGRLATNSMIATMVATL